MPSTNRTNVKRYILKDSLGVFVRAFKTYQEASTYKFVFGNYGWYIIKR